MGVCIGATITKPDKQVAQTAGSLEKQPNAAELLRASESNSRQFGGGMLSFLYRQQLIGIA